LPCNTSHRRPEPIQSQASSERKGERSEKEEKKKKKKKRKEKKRIQHTIQLLEALIIKDKKKGGGFQG